MNCANTLYFLRSKKLKYLSLEFFGLLRLITIKYVFIRNKILTLKKSDFIRLYNIIVVILKNMSNIVMKNLRRQWSEFSHEGIATFTVETAGLQVVFKCALMSISFRT